MSSPERQQKTPRSVINSLVGAMAAAGPAQPESPRLTRGEVASLRRASPEQPGSPTFWRICMRFVEPHVYPSGRWSDETESKWIAILALIADLHALHAPNRPIGAALREAGVSELRLLKLLRSSGRELRYHLRATSKLVATRGQRSDLNDWAELILNDSASSGRSLRRSVARAYYRPERNDNDPRGDFS